MNTGGAVLHEVDRGWKALRATMDLIKRAGSHVKVGFLDNGEGNKDHDGLTNTEIAAVHEFGTDDGHIPARPFVSGSFEKNAERYKADLALLIGKVYEGILTIEKALSIMGIRMASDIYRYVTTGAGVQPPLAEVTIERKGSSRPLLDTERMIGAITWAVFMMGGSKAQGSKDAG